MKKALLWGIGGAGLLLAVLFMVFLSQNASTIKSEVERQKPDIKDIQREDVSIKGEKREVYRVGMTGAALPTKEEMKALAEKVVSSEPSARDWDEITVFLYLPETSLKGQAYAAANFHANYFQKIDVFGVDSLFCTKWHPRVKPGHPSCKK